MKKTAALMLILILLSCFTIAFAEQVPDGPVDTNEQQTDSSADGAFVFRDGIVWGMSEADLKITEKADLSSRREDGNTVYLIYGYANVSKYTADHILYVLVDDQLRAAMYIFSSNLTDTQFNYLTGALSQLYGTAVQVSKEEHTEEMKFCASYDASQTTSIFGWNTENVNIRIAIDSEIDVIYLDPTFTYTQEYNTFGL